MLPTFILIGAEKSGTTSLAVYLGGHPDVFMTRLKEPNFFSRPEQFLLGQDWYESLFDDAGDAPVRGEASTSYSKFPRSPGTPERIAAMVPDVQIMYLVRHPIDRIKSQYLQLVLRGKEDRPLADAVQEKAAYIDNSRYATQLDQYLEHFPRERIHVLTSDQLRADRAATLTRAYTFLGVDPTVLPAELEREYHVTTERYEQVTSKTGSARAALGQRLAKTPLKAFAKKPTTSPADEAKARAELPPDVLRKVEDELRPDIVRLREFLGPDFDGWGIG